MPPAGSGPSLLDALSAAAGDYALLAATDAGLLVATGTAGGYRPVYVLHAGDRIAACTALKPLLTLVRSLRLNEFFLAQSAVQEPPCDPCATPYAGIERVPSGQAWIVERGAIRKFDIVPSLRAQELGGRERDLAEVTRAELQVALSKSVESRSRFSIAVSGGVDSSALVALAADLSASGRLAATFNAYHWDFDTPAPGDDRPYLAAVQQHLGMRSRPVRPIEAADDFKDAFVIDAAPSPSPTVPLLIALARRAREDGAEVLLTGIGGDQVMDGHPTLLGALARQGHPLNALVRALKLRGPDIGGTTWRIREWVLQPAIGLSVPSPVRRARRRWARRMAHRWAGPRLRRHLDEVSRAPEQRPSLDWSPRERYEWLRSLPMFDMFNVLRAQVEIAAGGIVNRDPFLDDDFLRFVATLPPLALMAGDFRRGLLREAVRGFVPDAVRLRQTKAPLTAAVLEAMGPSGGFPSLRGLADAHMMADLGLVEPRAFRASFEEAARAPHEVPWVPLWPVLSTEAFLRWHAGKPIGLTT